MLASIVCASKLLAGKRKDTLIFSLHRGLHIGRWSIESIEIHIYK